jgi:DNA-binding MarR family transcriptional regulator
MAMATEAKRSRSEHTQLASDAAQFDALTVQLGWALHRQLSDRLKAFDLTVPQFTTMRALERLGCPCTMTELAEAAMQVPATMTGIVDRLEQRSLVERQRDPADRRSVLVTITDSGKELLAVIASAKRTRLEQFLETLPGNQRQELLTLLRAFLESLASSPREPARPRSTP